VIVCAALLAGCGSSSPPTGTLTNADIPASLQLQENHSSAAQNLAKAFNQSFPGCIGRYAVFTLKARPTSPVLAGSKIYPQLFAESATCASTGKAQSVFAEVSARAKTFGVTTVTGVGDSAFLSHSSSKTANSFDIFWRAGPVLASIQLSGPVADKQISVAETTLLARRQVARG
jgi:hypothetical protein